MSPPIRTEAPAEMPVSLADVKAHCRVDHNDSNAVLTALLAAAVDFLDGPNGMLGKCMVEQTWQKDFDAFDGCLRLPVGPVASITSVTYYDADNALQTLSTDHYALRFNALGAYIDLKPGEDWPASYDRDDAVRVTFVAGVPVGEVPASLKTAVLMLVSQWNEDREGKEEISSAVRHLVGMRRDMFV